LSRGTADIIFSYSILYSTPSFSNVAIFLTISILLSQYPKKKFSGFE
jgi:hypothetical protein